MSNDEGKEIKQVFTVEDSKAAQQFLTELRTRIATQPLPYQYGVEASALTSMWEIFGHARTAIRDNPGCEVFADEVTGVLNMTVRPLTAKWHRALTEGRLNGRDGADAFRGELLVVQKMLRDYAKNLHLMAYGHEFEDSLTPDAMDGDELKRLFHPVAFGFTAPGASAVEKVAQIQADEAKAVADRRKERGVATEPGQDAIGLALSGGGIRSATFSLGVIQVLAQKGLLKEVDFLSTVSGGGYAGSFLTSRLGAGEPLESVGAPDGPDTLPMNYVRMNARYFASGNLKERWSMVCATIAGMVLNWTAALLIILTLAIAGILWGEAFVKVRPGILSAAWKVILGTMVVYGIGIRCGRKWSGITGGVLSVVMALTGLVGATALLDTVFLNWSKVLNTPWKWGISMGAVATVVPAVIRFVPVLKNPRIRRIVLKVLLLVAGVVVPCLAILLFYALLSLGKDALTPLLVTACLLSIVSLGVVNINLTAPHRLYRDGLARTFVQKSPDEPPVPLQAINPDGSAPYHILNASLNVPSSGTSSLKDRGCDFFMFSKEWTGSVSTGYHKTEKWKASGSELDLGTAMAVSGAAFSTHMGLGSMPSLTALLTLLNVRLGFWIKKPDAGGCKIPGFTCLLRETFGLGMTEESDWLNLSDGGHIENMAVYELLRRRCKFIICVDGEADPDFTFQGLMTLVRHARIDFGITISPVLDDLRPDPLTKTSKSHFHFCRIDYPGNCTGFLLYLKLSVTGNESELIRRYRTNHPEFPHQTTLDQFFDQEQFEAYRQLGVHVANGLFKPALMSQSIPDSIPDWFRKLGKNLLESEVCKFKKVPVKETGRPQVSQEPDVPVLPDASDCQ